jgi:enamidase
MRKTVGTLVSLLLLTASSSMAQEPTLVVENGRVIVADGTVLQGASVAVAGDSILSITEEPVEAHDARRIDASGKTVLPGLIDAHVHLTIPPDGRDSTALARHLQERVPDILEAFLTHGVTTIRATGDYWPWIRYIRERVAHGDISGPRIVTAGPVLSAPEGNPAVTICSGLVEGGDPGRADPFCRSRLAREIAGPEEARKAVRELAEQGVDFVKLASDTLFAPVLMDGEVIEAIADQADREGLKAVGHVYEAKFMASAARAGLDGFVHPPTMARPLPDERARELAELLAEAGTPVTSTLTPPMFMTDQPGPYLEDQLSNPRGRASHAQDLAIFAEAGVPVVLGSDWCGCFPNTREDPHPAIQAGAVAITEMRLLELGDLSRREVIQAATANAARALEMEDQVGTLEAGKLADLIVVDGNPLENLSALENVEVAVQGGEVVSGG